MSGRRDLFQRNSGDPDFLQKFDRMIEDIEKGRTPAKIIAEHLGISERSLRDNIKARKQVHAQSATYAKFERWKQIPGTDDFEQWVRNRFTGGARNKGTGKAKAADKIIALCETIWRNQFDRKHPALLTKADFINASVWAKQLPEGSRLHTMIAIRCFIRSGLSPQGRDWLDDLSTKGLKYVRDFPPEFTNADELAKVIPRLYHAFDKLALDGQATLDEVRALEMAIDIKRAFGPRTGDPQREMEVWGMRLDEGKSPLHFAGGELQSLKWFAKGGFNWGPYNRQIINTNGKVVQEIESYVEKYDLHTGDFLMGKLPVRRAYEMLNAGCKIAELTPLRLHDFRKMYASVGILQGVPMEKLCDMGVGWKDVATLKRYYLTLKPANIEASYATMAEFQNLV